MTILIPIVILIIVVIIRLLPKKHHDIIVDMSDSDILSNVRNFSLSMRNPLPYGAGISIRGTKNRLEKSYGEIANRVRNSKDIYEFEKLIFENFHLLRKMMNKSYYKGFSTLPHKNLNPRIVSLAHFIVNSSARKLSKEKIKLVVSRFNQNTPLDYKELTYLKNALTYILFKDLSLFAKRSNHYYLMRLSAEMSPTVNQNNYMSDSYMYYYIKKWGIPQNIKILNRSNIDIKTIEESFITALIDNSVGVDSIITSIRNLDDILDDKIILELSTINSLLLVDENYKNMDVDSINVYLDNINMLANKLNTSERVVAETLISLGNSNGVHFGEYIFSRHRYLKKYISKGKNIEICKPLRDNSSRYIFVITFFSILFGILFSLILTYSIWARIGIGILVALSMIKPIEFVYSYAFRPQRRFMPKMSYEKIPNDASSTVVVSELLTKNSVKKAIEHIQVLSRNCLDENVSYVLLADLLPSRSEKVSDDISIIKQLREEFAKVTDKRINILIRKRVKNGSLYHGRERKRGALQDFLNTLMTGDESCYLYMARPVSDAKYMIMLDADNELLPNSILKVINSILHPLNRKYDLLAFGSATNMHSIRTHYSKRYISECGIPDYGKNNDFIFNLSDRCIFCGKGIVRVEDMHNKLKDFFPNNRILSHDIIEGAVLSTGSMSENVYEDAPTSIQSDIERKSRWIRGDFQLLPYLFKDKVVKPIYKYIIFSNGIGNLLQAFQFALIILSFITGNSFLIIATVLTLFSSTVLELLSALKGINNNIRLRYVLLNCYTVIKKATYRLLMIPFNAVNGLMLFVITLYRLIISKKNLLSWKTFSSSQGSSKYHAYLGIIMPSMLVMSLLSILLFEYLWLSIYFLGSILYMLIVYLYGKEIKHTITTSEYNCNILRDYASDTYRFFDEFMVEDTNYLIPDNYQVYPYRGCRHSTSPTNIGLSLTAIISAIEMEIIDLKYGISKIVYVIGTIEKMPKWNGHLYNWYNTKELKSLYPNFISSVDSANFVACLIVVKEFLLANKKEELANRVKEIIDNSDFSKFFDNAKQLYYIGFNENNNKFSGHYDLLASESRILSYIAIARGGNIDSWLKLNRECTKLRGNTLLSWSGTAFEYLMPEIFLNTPKYGLLGKSITNCIYEQMSNKTKGLWGMSECGFYRFNSDLSYDYLAIGIRSLAMRSEYTRAVIAPYASMLALPFMANECVANLKMMKSNNMYGEYGFYEAIDMYARPRIVNSYMAHHLGMSIVSIANCIKDNCISKYFMKDHYMQSARLLLTENRTYVKTSKEQDENLLYSDGKENEVESISLNKLGKQYNILANGSYTVVCDEYGVGYSVNNGIYHNKSFQNMDSGFFSYFKDKTGKVFSPTFSPLRDEIDNFSVEYSASSSIYRNDKEDVEMLISVPPCFGGEIRKFTIDNNTDSSKVLKAFFYMDINLNNRDRYLAHPAFNDMFIKTFYDIEHNAIIAERIELNGKDKRYSAFVINGVESIQVSTDRMDFIGRNRTTMNPVILEDELKANNVGATIYPCYSAQCDIEVPPNGKKEIYISLIMANTLEDIQNAIIQSKSEDFINQTVMASKLTNMNFYHRGIKNNKEFRNVLNSLLNRVYNSSQLKELGLEENRKILSAFGISDFQRYIYMDYTSESESEELCKLCNIANFLKAADVDIKVVVVYRDISEYHQTLVRHIYNDIKVCNANDKVIVIDKNKHNKQELLLIKELAYASKDNLRYNDNEYTLVNKMNKIELKPQEFKEKVLNSGEGNFLNNGDYMVKAYGQSTLLPYCNVIGGLYGGTVISNNGGGYTYFNNCREEKLTVFNNDPVSDIASERVYLINGNDFSRINTDNSGLRTIHSKGITSFNGVWKSTTVKHSEYMIKDGKIKVWDTVLVNKTIPVTFSVLLDIDISLGWKANPEYTYIEHLGRDIIIATNIITKQRVGLRVYNEGEVITEKERIRNRSNGIYDIALNPEVIHSIKKGFAAMTTANINPSARIVYMVSEDIEMLMEYDLSRLDYDMEDALAAYNNINNITIKSNDKALDILVNDWLLYQVVSSRLNARGGYYQAGGAIGFRDQLQDLLPMLFSRPSYVREKLLEIARHQYLEGDVMHWWHYDRYGVRTLIKDDAVFLAYVANEYIKATGDRKILEIEIEYMESEQLRENEHSRLETPKISSEKSSLLIHLKRALESVLEYGKHNLLLIGGGDWNDALDCIGTKGKGESVWLTQFAYMVLKDLCVYVPTNERIKFVKICEKLQNAVNDGAFDGKWFRRAYTDDGEWLGSIESKVCKIDILSQAFAVLSNITDTKRNELCLESAKQLINKDLGLIKLLSPPFNNDKWYGYISAYPEGVRENGGQYTHATIWYIMALIKVGKVDEAYNLFTMISPIHKCISKDKCIKYKGEPYSFPADIYSCINYGGQMGWNFYTGSAGWAYTLIIREFLGLKLVDGNLKLTPNLPKALDNICIEYRFEKTVYNINILHGDDKGMVYNGVKVGNGNFVMLENNLSKNNIVLTV